MGKQWGTTLPERRETLPFSKVKFLRRWRCSTRHVWRLRCRPRLAAAPGESSKLPGLKPGTRWRTIHGNRAIHALGGYL